MTPSACAVDQASSFEHAAVSDDAGGSGLSAQHRDERTRARAAYERPTEEKRFFGERMRRAREASGLSLTEAATAIGYSQPVQLSLMENGLRLPPVLVLLKFAQVTGTTMDYLTGMADNVTPDPVIQMQRAIAARVTADMRRLIGGMTAISVDVVRELRPDSGRMARLAGLALEAVSALEWVRMRSPEFDDLQGGSRLVAKIVAAGALASEHAQAEERARRALRVCSSAFTFDCLDDEPSGPEGHSLNPLAPLSEQSMLEEG